MKLIHRPIDFLADRTYVLERHCRINYECDCPWARRTPYQDYRHDWFLMAGQVNEFYTYLQETASDDRTIAEIIETEDGQKIGYLWAPFHMDAESNFAFAEIQDIYIEEAFRKQGLATQLLTYVEKAAKANGAKVLRSGTGCENTVSINLHKKLAYYPYRYEFEKVL